MAITDTVHLTDLIARYKDELSDLRDAYDDLIDWAEDEHGDRREQWPDAARQTAQAYEEAAKRIEARISFLEKASDEYGDEPFEIRMLSGQETMEIETELRMKANKRDVDVEVIQHERNRSVVDTAVVDAPEGFPTDDDGSPVPSEAPNPLTLSLHEAVESLNQAGEADFRASGFDSEDALDAPESFEAPSN